MHAHLGRLTAFRRTTSQAQDIFHDTAPGTPVPDWLGYFDESELAGVTGA